MQTGRIKTEWASLSMAQDGNVIVCAKRGDVPCCMRFNSLEHLKHAIDNKKMLVKKWAVAVPGSLCILKPVALPALDLAEAAKMVEFELPSLIPLPPETIVYGCTLLNKQDNMLNILVCIVKLKTLNQYLEPYKAIGTEPQRIILDSLAIQNWFNTTGAATQGPGVSVFVNKDHCVVLTSINGNFHKAAELTLSGADVATSLREIVEEILNQRDELSAWLKKTTFILLAGAKEYVSEIKRLLSLMPPESAFTPKVSVISNPQITYYEDGGYKHDNSSSRWEAAVAAGLHELAANSKLPHSNLLPQQYVRSFQRKLLLFNCFVTGGLSLLLLLLLWLCLTATSWRIERVSHKIELQIAPIEHIAGSVESKRQRVKAIQKQLSNRGQITQIAEELYRYTPKTISISELRFTSTHSKASIEIKGQADSLSSAFEYTDAMSKADLLDKIQIINVQQIPRPGGSVVEFKANCVIRRLTQ